MNASETRHTPTKAMVRALTAATLRERGNICPIRGTYAAAETVLIKAMDERGYIAWDGPAPRISDAGRAIAKAVQS